MSLRGATCLTMVTHRSTAMLTWVHHRDNRKGFAICFVDLCPEIVSRCASALPITTYGSAHSRVLDNRFAAKSREELSSRVPQGPSPSSLSPLPSTSTAARPGAPILCPTAVWSFVPFLSPLTVLGRARLRNEMTKAHPDGCIELWISEFLMRVERLRSPQFGEVP
jgi:hypothetical protein